MGKRGKRENTYLYGYDIDEKAEEAFAKDQMENFEKS